ncbi:MAG TPA: winged helix-turn-helix domain-containing protein [Herpetosiphonaceae bacterium]
MSEINPFARLLVSFEPQMFIGRALDVRTILLGVSSDEPRSFALHGVRTIGKTTLLKFLAHDRGARERYRSTLVHYGVGGDRTLRCVYVNTYQLDGGAVLRAIYDELLRLDLIRPADADLAADDAEQALLKETLLTQLRAKYYNAKERLVICLDHFDKPFSSLKLSDDAFLRSLTNYQSFVIVTERRLAELRRDANYVSPLVNVLSPRTIGLLTQTEAYELAEKPATRAGAPFSREEAQFLVELGGRQPYLLATLCDQYFDMRDENPELSGLLAEQRARQHVLAQVEASAPVEELFKFFWSLLDDEYNPAGKEKETLLKIATGQEIDMDRDKVAVNRLLQLALIYDNLEAGRYAVFGELFRSYVRRHLGATSIAQIAESLPPLDRRLFEYLLARPNQICPIEELFSEVWGSSAVNKRPLEAAIHRIRNRIQDLDPAWDYIQNVRGQGYQYVPKPG